MSSSVIGSRKTAIIEMSFKLMPESMLQAFVRTVELVNDASDSLLESTRVYTRDSSRTTSKSYRLAEDVFDCVSCVWLVEELDPDEPSNVCVLAIGTLLDSMVDPLSKNLTDLASSL
jgi:hypothetical protein